MLYETGDVIRATSVCNTRLQSLVARRCADAITPAPGCGSRRRYKIEHIARLAVSQRLAGFGYPVTEAAEIARVITDGTVADLQAGKQLFLVIDAPDGRRVRIEESAPSGTAFTAVNLNESLWPVLRRLGIGVAS